MIPVALKAMSIYLDEPRPTTLKPTRGIETDAHMKRAAPDIRPTTLKPTRGIETDHEATIEAAKGWSDNPKTHTRD